MQTCCVTYCLNDSNTHLRPSDLAFDLRVPHVLIKKCLSPSFSQFLTGRNAMRIHPHSVCLRNCACDWGSLRQIQSFHLFGERFGCALLLRSRPGSWESETVARSSLHHSTLCQDALGRKIPSRKRCPRLGSKPGPKTEPSDAPASVDSQRTRVICRDFIGNDTRQGDFNKVKRSRRLHSLTWQGEETTEILSLYGEVLKPRFVWLGRHGCRKMVPKRNE